MSNNGHWSEADALYQILSMVAEDLFDAEKTSDQETKLEIINSVLRKYESRRWPEKASKLLNL